MKRHVLWAVGLLVGCMGSEAGPATLAEGDVVKVVEIVKGDEITVQKGEQKARVRLVGIHAFSAVVADAQVAALSQGGVAALQDLVANQSVKIAFDKPMQDTTGRYLAYLDKEGLDVNRRLIEEGWSVVYTEYSFAREQAYLTAEQSAREKQRNLWGLRPAADLVRGLRRQWKEARASAGSTALVDLLLEAPAAPQAEAAPK